MRALSTALFLALLLPAAAMAQTGEDPEVVDACGIRVAENNTVLGGDPDHPSVDICTADFETLSVEEEPTVMTVTVALADETMPDMRTARVSWTSSNCEFDVTARDSDRAQLAEVAVGSPDTVDALVRCGRHATPCTGPVTLNCSAYGFDSVHERTLELGRVAFDGSTVTFTLDFTDPALADFADLHLHGMPLTDLEVAAAINVFGGGVGDFMCIGSTCVGATTDTAYGEGYIVGT